jgi:hypothetical protein
MIPAQVSLALWRSRGNGDDHGGPAIDAYITKPIDFDQLFAKIAELTNPAQLASRAGESAA